jgi:hypothetical protein
MVRAPNIYEDADRGGLLPSAAATSASFVGHELVVLTPDEVSHGLGRVEPEPGSNPIERGTFMIVQA